MKDLTIIGLVLLIVLLITLTFIYSEISIFLVWTVVLIHFIKDNKEEINKFFNKL